MPQLAVGSSSSPSPLLPSEHLTSASTSNHTMQGGEKDGQQQLDSSRLDFSPTPQSMHLVVPVPAIMDIEGGLNSEREFICGSGAAFINICITFPINKAIFRQQLHGVSSVHALNQLKKDGLRYLYRGLLPPLLQKTASMSIMFGSYSRCQDLIQDIAPSLSTVPNHILSALIAGTLEAALTPFERVQTLMQNRHYHDKFSNTLDTFKHLRRFGFTEYYRGFSVIILRNGPSNVCFFLGREFLAEKGPIPKTQSQKVMKDFICGACLGAFISSVYFPFNVVKAHMQSQLGGPFTSFYRTFRVLLRERDGSIRKLFKGVHLNYTRSFVSWGIVNASYEFLLHTFFQVR